MTDARDGIGGNVPPLGAAIEFAYSTLQLANDHADLALEVQALGARASAFTQVGDPVENEAAAALVIELRATARKVDETRETVKAPILTASRNIDGFFNGLNSSDTKRPGPLTAAKLRIERLVSGYAFQVAERERQARLEAERRERERAEAEAKAAAEEEARNRPAVAQVLVEQAVKSEAIADKHAEIAAGPVQELARSRSNAGTTGLRKVAGFEVVDVDALRATLGPLGRSFTTDAVYAAIRKFRIDSEAVEAWAFRDDDQHAQRRIVVASPPLPGVEFCITYEGSVRA